MASTSESAGTLAILRGDRRRMDSQTEHLYILDDRGRICGVETLSGSSISIGGYTKTLRSSVTVATLVSLGDAAMRMGQKGARTTRNEPLSIASS